MKALFFGDSWSLGIDALPRCDGFAWQVAARLGYEAVVDAVGGTGYASPGATDEPYPARLVAQRLDPAPELVVLQGGLNDRDRPTVQVRCGARNAITLLRMAYPEAHLVMVGPAPATRRMAVRLRRVDRVLRHVADERDVQYVSPLTEGWFPLLTLPRFMRNNGSGPHPNSAGHTRFADRLTGALTQTAWPISGPSLPAIQ